MSREAGLSFTEPTRVWFITYLFKLIYLGLSTQVHTESPQSYPAVPDADSSRSLFTQRHSAPGSLCPGHKGSLDNVPWEGSFLFQLAQHWLPFTILGSFHVLLYFLT